MFFFFFLPTQSDINAAKENLVVLVSQILTRNMHGLSLLMLFLELHRSPAIKIPAASLRALPSSTRIHSSYIIVKNPEPIPLLLTLTVIFSLTAFATCSKRKLIR